MLNVGDRPQAPARCLAIRSGLSARRAGSSALWVAAALSCAPPWAHGADVSHQFTPYLWGAGMSGVVGAGGVETDVDASFSDIMSNLELGFMATYRADIGKDWAIAADGMYIGLGGSGRGPNGLAKSRVDVDQSVVELDVGRKITPAFAVVAGARYVDMTSEATTQGPLGNRVTFRTDADWIDPVLGVVVSTGFSEKGAVLLRADAGGFGVGSNLSWQLVGSVGYRASPGLTLVAAYRHLDIDYDSGSGAGQFRFDAAMSGPALGVAFSWK